MRNLFYRLLGFFTKIFGVWLFVVTSRIIAAGYFILFPRRIAVGVRFYRVLFPDRNRLYHCWCTWRQFQNFTSIFLDRLVLQSGGDIPYTFQGRQHLIQALERKTGGIILMSHIGNWEIAAHLLHRSVSHLPLMLYMGKRGRDEIESIQKQDLLSKGIQVVAVDQDDSSPFDLLEGVSFLREGGFISMTGDMTWHQDQRTVEVEFLNHRVRLPETPYILALLSGAPLLVFFTSLDHPDRGRQYHFSLSEPFLIHAETRDQRGPAVQQAAQTYASMMEEHLRRVPFEWYHFEPFLGQRPHNPSNSRNK